MKLRSIENFNKVFIVGNRNYNLAAQISYYNSDLIDSNNNHFYSRVKIGDHYYKMDGKNSTTKDRSANPDKVIFALYKVNGGTETVEENLNYIYDTKALAFFRRSTEKYKETDRKSKLTKYQEPDEKERKKEYHKKWYYEEEGKDSKKEYDEKRYHEEGGKEKKKEWYDEEGGKEKRKEWYYEEGGKDSKKEYNKKMYHEEGGREKMKKIYDEEGGKEKKKEWYIKNRENRLQYATQYFKKQDKIKKILTQHFHSYDSGMEYLCVSCTRLHSKGNVSRHRPEVNVAIDEKLILTSKTKNIDENFYLCSNCRPALIKGLPRLNFSKTADMDKIGSLPNHLPDLNILESYLLKINIPFIRVSHVPRSPNLKLVGGSVCIEADINHTISRLQINPETIIPVSFKRKLSYTGYYLEQVIKKNQILSIC